MDDRVRRWVVDGTRLRACEPGAFRGHRSWVSLHNHTSHSTENIASLNWVVRLWYMRPFAGLLQRAFGLAPGERLDYREVTYHPLVTPDALRLVEQEHAHRLGLPGLILAITDHDGIAGGLELAAQHGGAGNCLPLGVELTIPFDGQVFHLGVSGLPADTAIEEHAGLQASCAAGDLDSVFGRLRRLGCLVVLNHPLLPWDEGALPEAAVSNLLARHGHSIDALELNGMRGVEENEAVLALADRVRKPIVGGGDSHLLVPGAAGCVTRAETFAAFVDEVRSGRTQTVVTADYFAPLGWRLVLRVLNFIAHYREIAHFRGRPVAEILDGRRVLLDPVGRAAGWFVDAARRLGRVS
jgi:predicted metal-dependent phosphoesterase TrpH